MIRRIKLYFLWKKHNQLKKELEILQLAHYDNSLGNIMELKNDSIKLYWKRIRETGNEIIILLSKQ